MASFRIDYLSSPVALGPLPDGPIVPTVKSKILDSQCTESHDCARGIKLNGGFYEDEHRVWIPVDAVIRIERLIQ